MTRGCGNDPLTPGQLRMLVALAHGATQRQAARRFGLSQAAVSKQVRAMRQRLGAETVAHAVLLAERAGLIPGGVGGAVRPVAAPEAPEPCRDAVGRSGGDGEGSNGAGKPSSAGPEVTEARERLSQASEAPEVHSSS